MIADSIDDIKYHTDQDQKHSESDSDDKYCIQPSYQWNVHHCLHGLQPYGVENFFKSEDTSVHKSEKGGKYTGAADNACKVHVLFLIQEQTAKEKDQSLSHISEHGSEDQGIGNSHKPCGVQLVISRKAVHFYIHFKRPEQLRIVKLCWRCLFCR